MILGIIIDWIIHNKRNVKIRISNEILEPRSRQRIEKMSKLLEKCEIDINNKRELDALIKYAKAERDKYDVWRSVKRLFTGLSKYIIIPIITIFITELFKDVDFIAIVYRAIVLIFVIAIVLLSTVSFATTINDIANSELRKVDDFIRDIEELKVFNNKVKSIAAEMKGV